MTFSTEKEKRIGGLFIFFMNSKEKLSQSRSFTKTSDWIKDLQLYKLSHSSSSPSNSTSSSPPNDFNNKTLLEPVSMSNSWFLTSGFLDFLKNCWFKVKNPFSNKWDERFPLHNLWIHLHPLKWSFFSSIKANSKALQQEQTEGSQKPSSTQFSIH